MAEARALAELSRAYLLQTLRSKTALFWNLAFPLVWLFAFGFIFGRGTAEGVTEVMPGLFAIAIMAGSFFSVAYLMVSEREQGILRRYRVTPVSALTVVMANAVRAVVTLVVSVGLMAVVARLVFGITVASPLWVVASVLVAGIVAFVPLGLIIGSVAQDMRSAPAMANLIFFPMMFLSGATVPFWWLPGWLQGVGRLLPATYLTEALQGVVVRGDGLGDLLAPLTVLAITAAVASAMNGLLFRWESTEAVSLRRLAVVVAGLTALYGAAALLSPNLGMAREPRPAAGGQVRVLRGLTVLDGLGGRIRGARVTIRDDRIVEVRADDDGPLPEGAAVEDLQGLYLIPGLIDSHVHLGGSAGGAATAYEFSPGRIVRDLQVYLAVGVTTIVSLTDDLELLTSLRAAVTEGRMRAPRPFYSGPPITAPGGHPAEMFRLAPGMAARLTRQVATAEEARQAVRDLAAQGVDLIKLVLERGWPGRELPWLSEEALRAAVEEARQAGVRTTVHATRDADARLAVEAGARGLEHVAPDLADATVELLRQRQVSLTPTLVVMEGLAQAGAGTGFDHPLVVRWVDPRILESLGSPLSWLATAPQQVDLAAEMKERLRAAVVATRRAARGGATILAGSDAGNPGAFHGPALIRELELLVEEVGLAPSEALAAATSRAADRLGRADLGRVVPGALADLVVLGGDPTVRVSAYRDVRAVYLGGQPLDPEELLRTSPGDWPAAR